jgi:hypothetical protein
MATSSLFTLTMDRLAIITGISGLLALALLILFFTIGGPFGTLNDIFNGLTGILSGMLAWKLSTRFQISLVFLIMALLGALAVVLGSILVIFEITGWYLAGLYTSAGYALIGLWLLALNASVRQINSWPQRLVTFGLITGMIMALGLLVLPGLINKIDAWESGPWYINYVGQLGAIGYLLLYPIWCMLVGRGILFK